MTNAHSTALVSIIIPVYNGAQYLAEAINSVLAQSYQNIEVLVVNDGSTDAGATEAVAKSFGHSIRYFYKPNGHVASALNFGVGQMRGQYFSWLSHDDRYVASKIEVQMHAIGELGPNVAVYGDFEILEQETQVVTPIPIRSVAPEKFRYSITVASLLHGCTLVIPKECLDAAGRFDESLRTTQDYDMWFRLARYCRFVHIPGIVVTSRHHAEQGTRALRDVVISESDRLLTGFIRQLTQDEVVTGTGKELAAAYAYLAATMQRRGFKVACATALELSRSASREQPLLRRTISLVLWIFVLRIQPALLSARRFAGRVSRPFRSRWHRALTVLNVNKVV